MTSVDLARYLLTNLFPEIHLGVLCQNSVHRSHLQPMGATIKSQLVQSTPKHHLGRACVDVATYVTPLECHQKPCADISTKKNQPERYFYRCQLPTSLLPLVPLPVQPPDLTPPTRHGSYPWRPLLHISPPGLTELDKTLGL
jgi:hypothetical protein